MSRRSFVAAVGMVVLCGLQVNAQQHVVGSWFGAVPLRGGDLTLQFDITRSDSGIAAVMDIAESRLIRFPVPDSRFEQGSLVLSVPRGWGLALSRDIGLTEDERIIRFEGRPAGDSITGTLRIAYATFPLTLRRIGAVGAQVRRQDLTWANGAVSLSGTLYLPEHGGPFPAIVFTHSSGDLTREAYAAEAQRLAGAGIAALVYDKRGGGRRRARA